MIIIMRISKSLRIKHNQHIGSITIELCNACGDHQFSFSVLHMGCTPSGDIIMCRLQSTSPPAGTILLHHLFLTPILSTRLLRRSSKRSFAIIDPHRWCSFSSSTGLSPCQSNRVKHLLLLGPLSPQEKEEEEGTLNPL